MRHPFLPAGKHPPGAACDISDSDLWGERRFEGIVSAINPEVESENRSVKVTIEDCQSQRRTAQRHVCQRRNHYRQGSSRALVIPRDSLIPEKEGSETAGVYVVREGKAHRVEIKIGDSQLEIGVGPAGPSGRGSGDHGDRPVLKRRNSGSRIPITVPDSGFRIPDRRLDADPESGIRNPESGIWNRTAAKSRD